MSGLTILNLSVPKKPPGTAFVEQSKLHGVSVPWWCTFHHSPIRPEWIAAGGQVLPACPWCLKEEIPETTLAEAKAQEAITTTLDMCAREGCDGLAKDNCCQFCTLSFCDSDMEVTGPQGLCKNCGRE